MSGLLRATYRSCSPKTMISTTVAVLPTGRLFGRITQKWPNKKWSGRPSEKCYFLLLFCDSREVQTIFYLSQSHRQKWFVFFQPNALKTVKISMGPDSFLGGRISPPGWPENSAKGWKHCSVGGSALVNADPGSCIFGQCGFGCESGVFITPPPPKNVKNLQLKTN